MGEDENLAIRPKEAANCRIKISSMQRTIISWLAIRIIPFMALVIGVFIWWQRS